MLFATFSGSLFIMDGPGIMKLRWCIMLPLLFALQNVFSEKRIWDGRKVCGLNSTISSDVPFDLKIVVFDIHFSLAEKFGYFGYKINRKITLVRGSTSEIDGRSCGWWWNLRGDFLH